MLPRYPELHLQLYVEPAAVHDPCTHGFGVHGSVTAMKWMKLHFQPYVERTDVYNTCTHVFGVHEFTTAM